MVYLDFGKEYFDKVDHEILLSKVEAYVIRGKILTWLATLLGNRVQQVGIGLHLPDEVKGKPKKIRAKTGVVRTRSSKTIPMLHSNLKPRHLRTS